jgi:hypothetical protein
MQQHWFTTALIAVLAGAVGAIGFGVAGAQDNGDSTDGVTINVDQPSAAAGGVVGGASANGGAPTDGVAVVCAGGAGGVGAAGAGAGGGGGGGAGGGAVAASANTNTLANAVQVLNENTNFNDQEQDQILVSLAVPFLDGIPDNDIASTEAPTEAAPQGAEATETSETTEEPAPVEE